MRWAGILLSLLTLSGCDFRDRGIARLQVVEDLVLGTSLEEVKDHWYLYSKKPFLVDQEMSTSSAVVYRGESRDTGVTGFYMFFNSKNRVLEQVEWRYHSSMTEAKEKELLDLWTKKLGEPSLSRRWGGHVYAWSDRRAKLELYISDGICHLIHRLK